MGPTNGDSMAHMEVLTVYTCKGSANIYGLILKNNSVCEVICPSQSYELNDGITPHSRYCFTLSNVDARSIFNQVGNVLSKFRTWWFSIAQSVCKWAFTLLAIWCPRPSFESYIQQRKATCLLSIRKLLAFARRSKFTTTNLYVCMCVPTHSMRDINFVFI